MSSSSNQKHSIAIGILILCFILLTTNYIAGERKTNYFELLRSPLDYLTYDVHLKPVRVCCLVPTAPENFLIRVRAVNETWGPSCDRFFFITEIPVNLTLEQKQFVKQVSITPIHNIIPGRNHLTQKSILAFLFAYKNCLNDCDWFIKADDDTYLISSNLWKFLLVLVKDGYHSGGASYVLSREALRRFYQGHQIPNNRYCQEEIGAEDLMIARCLRERGVRLGKSLDEQNRELFHPLSFLDHFRGAVPDWLKIFAQNLLQFHYNCRSDQSISFHYVSSDDLYYLDFLLYKVRLYILVKSFDLEDVFDTVLDKINFI